MNGKTTNIADITMTPIKLENAVPFSFVNIAAIIANSIGPKRHNKIISILRFFRFFFLLFLLLPFSTSTIGFLPPFAALIEQLLLPSVFLFVQFLHLLLFS